MVEETLLRQARLVHFELVYALITGNSVIEYLATANFYIETVQLLSYIFHPTLPWGVPVLQTVLSYALLPWHSDPVVWCLLAILLSLLISFGVLCYEIIARGGITSFRLLNGARLVTGIVSSIGFFPVLEKLLKPLQIFLYGNSTVYQLPLVVCCLVMLPLFFVTNFLITMLWFDPNPLVLGMFKQSTPRIQVLTMITKTIVALAFSLAPTPIVSSLILVIVFSIHFALALVYPQFAHPLTNSVSGGFAAVLLWGSLCSFAVDLCNTVFGSTDFASVMLVIVWSGLPIALIVGMLAIYVRNVKLVAWRHSLKNEYWVDPVKPTPSPDAQEILGIINSDIDKVISKCWLASDVDYVARLLIFRDNSLFAPVAIRLLGRAIDHRFPKSAYLHARLLLYLSYLPSLANNGKSVSISRTSNNRLIRRIRALQPPPLHDIHFIIFFAHRKWEHDASQVETGETTQLDALGSLHYLNNIRKAEDAQQRALDASLRFWISVAQGKRGRALAVRYAIIRQQFEVAAAWYYQVLFDRFPKSHVVLRNYASLIDGVVSNSAYAERVLQLAQAVEEDSKNRGNQRNHNAFLLENICSNEAHSTIPVRATAELIAEAPRMIDQTVFQVVANDSVSSVVNHVSPSPPVMPSKQSSRSSISVNELDDEEDKVQIQGNIYQGAITSRHNSQATSNIRRVAICIYASMLILLLGLTLVYSIGKFQFLQVGNGEASVVGSSGGLRGNAQLGGYYARQLELALMSNSSAATITNLKKSIGSAAKSLNSSLALTYQASALRSDLVSQAWYDEDRMELRLYHPVGQWKIVTDSVLNGMESLIDALLDLSSRSVTNVQALQNLTSFRFVMDNIVREEFIDAQLSLVDAYDQTYAANVVSRRQQLILMTVLANIIPLFITLALFLPSMMRLKKEVQLTVKLLFKIPAATAQLQVQRFTNLIRSHHLNSRENIANTPHTASKGLSSLAGSAFNSPFVKNSLNRRSRLGESSSHNSSIASADDASSASGSVSISSDSNATDFDFLQLAADALKNSSSVTINTRAAHGVRYLLATFIAIMAILSIMSLGIMAVLLIENEANRANAQQINYSGVRRTWSVRVATLATEIIRNDPSTWPDTSRDQIRGLMSQSIDLFQTAHDIVTRGNSTLGIPNIVQNPTAVVQNTILFTPSCDTSTNVSCWNMEQTVNYFIRQAQAFLLVTDQDLSYNVDEYKNMVSLLFNQLLPMIESSKSDFVNNGNPWSLIASFVCDTVFAVALVLFIVMIGLLQLPLNNLNEFVCAVRNVLFTLPMDRVILMPEVRDYLHWGKLYTRRELWANRQEDVELNESEEDGTNKKIAQSEHEDDSDEENAIKKKDKNVKWKQSVLLSRLFKKSSNSESVNDVSQKKQDISSPNSRKHEIRRSVKLPEDLDNQVRNVKDDEDMEKQGNAESSEDSPKNKE